MNVLVTANRIPFTRESDELCERLVTTLRAWGAQAEALHFPFTWQASDRLIEEMLIARSLRVGNVDCLIALSFPAYLIPHPNKVLWLLPLYRQTYDEWAESGSVKMSADELQRVREAIRRADSIAFSEARRVYTESGSAARKLQSYIGSRSLVLPLPDGEALSNAVRRLLW
jgi:hypothetical protein